LGKIDASLVPTTRNRLKFKHAGLVRGLYISQFKIMRERIEAFIPRP
jgi:hypothetical protein